jgi:hypothetical protein
MHLWNYNAIKSNSLVVYNAPYYPFSVGGVRPSNKWWFQPPFEMGSVIFSLDYQLDKFSLKKNSTKQYILRGGLGTGLNIGRMAGNLLFVTPKGNWFDFYMWHAFYELVHFVDISANVHLRITPPRKFFSISFYYAYLPTFAEYKRIFAGWLFEFNIGRP